MLFLNRAQRGPVRNIRDFLSLLRRDRQLAVVDAPVSTDLEIAEIHRRVIAAGGPALLFTNVRGSAFSVATNLFGTTDRAAMAFGSRPVEFVKQAVRFVEEGLPPTPAKLWRFRSLFTQGLRVGLKRRQRGPVLGVIRNHPRLRRLPFLKSWPEDGGHFITLPLVYTEDPENGKPNLGMYRIQRYSDVETGIHWQIGKGGGFHYHKAEKLGRSLPTTIFIGGPPALILSAIAPLPENAPEILLASLLLGERLPLCENPAGPHPLIAEAEFALIGEVDPFERRPEGPFGDHYGYYSLRHDYPVFRCRVLCRKKNAIYPATVVGKPRQEDYFIGEYLQELLSPLFPLVMPTVRNLWSYGETGFHALAAAVVYDRYDREALQSAFRILGEGQLSLTKFLLLTDTPIGLKDFRIVLPQILERVQWEKDLYLFSNVSMDTLDYAGPQVNKGSKGVIVALGEKRRELPREFRSDLPAGTRNAHVYTPGALVLDGPSFEEDKNFAAQLARSPAIADWPFVVLCDDAAKATSSTIAFLWTAFTRFDPAADLHAREVRPLRGHLSYTGPIVLDARMKPWYPPTVEPDPSVSSRVTRRWKEYFPQGMEMGDSAAGNVY